MKRPVELVSWETGAEMLCPGNPTTPQNYRTLVRSRTGITDRAHLTAQVSAQRGNPSDVHRAKSCTGRKAKMSQRVGIRLRDALQLAEQSA
jgi:hypothetical protein